MKKKGLRKIFGVKFNLWDIIFILILLGYPAYYLINNGLSTFIEELFSQIWFGIVIGYFIVVIMRFKKK